MFGLRTITDLDSGAEWLRRGRYGVIDVAAGELQAVRLRPFPKRISLLEIALWGRLLHQHRPGDRCWLYYNQPCGHHRFLALKYLVSLRGTSLATFRGSLRVLDEIARLKQSDAIVCEVSNLRISPRLLSRWGWARHLADDARRHYIKRFYGHYPQPLSPHRGDFALAAFPHRG